MPPEVPCRQVPRGTYRYETLVYTELANIVLATGHWITSYSKRHSSEVLSAEELNLIQCKNHNNEK